MERMGCFFAALVLTVVLGVGLVQSGGFTNIILGGLLLLGLVGVAAGSK